MGEDGYAGVFSESKGGGGKDALYRCAYDRGRPPRIGLDGKERERPVPGRGNLFNEANRLNERRKYFGEQFEFQQPEFGKLQIIPNNETIIDELRDRLRKAQAAQFRAEAQLAIVREERDKLAARLKEIAGSLYKLWRQMDGGNAGTRR
jgi:hypothetical protein